MGRYVIALLFSVYCLSASASPPVPQGAGVAALCASLPCSLSVTVAAGQNTALLVWLDSNGQPVPSTGPAVTSVTYGSAAMTQVAEHIGSGGSGVCTGVSPRADFYVLTSPPVGTANVTVSYGSAATPPTVLIGALAINNVNQAQPVRPSFTHAFENTGTSISNTVTSVKDDLIVDLVTNGTSITGVTGAGQTQAFLNNVNSASCASNLGGSYVTATGTSTTLGWNTANDVNLQMIIAIDPPTGLKGCGGSGLPGVLSGRISLNCALANSGPPSFFVSPSGNDSNNGLSPTFSSGVNGPFLTLAKCQTAMQNGTIKTCSLRAGTYNLTASIAMTTADNNETWQFYGPDGVDSPVIDCGGTVDCFTANIGNAGGANQPTNITFNGLKIQNPFDAAIAANFNNSTIENMDMGINHDHSEAGGFGPMFTVDGKNNVIKHNYCHDSQAQCMSFFAFNAGDSIDGTVVDSNVVLRACNAIVDCAGIYIDMKGTGVNGLGGHVTVSNNFVRDQGFAGASTNNGWRDIYLDDLTTNVTVTGNIMGPMISGQTNPDSSCLFLNGAANNTISNNICDEGLTTVSAIIGAGPCGSGGTASCSGPLGPNNVSNNIIVSNFAGNWTGNLFGLGNFIYSENNTIAGQPYNSAWMTISNNFYRNYGGGQTPTTGQGVSDSSPNFIDPGCSGYLYTLSAVPNGFTDVTAARSAGPTGFTIPTGTNHSC